MQWTCANNRLMVVESLNWSLWKLSFWINTRNSWPASACPTNKTAPLDKTTREKLVSRGLCRLHHQLKAFHQQLTCSDTRILSRATARLQAHSHPVTSSSGLINLFRHNYKHSTGCRKRQAVNHAFAESLAYQWPSLQELRSWVVHFCTVPLQQQAAPSKH